MTVFEKVQSMSKVEFADFMHEVYEKARRDGMSHEDDSIWIYHRLADCDYDWFKANFE